MEKHYVHPIGPINTDDAIEKIENNHVVDRVNCYGISEPGKGQRLVLLRNTILKTNNGLPLGENQIIGWCEWYAANSLIYFVWNDQQDHTIWRYSRDTEIHTLIVQGSFLNFPTIQPISGVPGARDFSATVRDNGLLYWNCGWFFSYLLQVNGVQGYNPPRKINIGKAISGGYPVIDWQTTMAAKFPYCLSPVAQFVTDTTRKGNNLVYRFYQFRVQYIYDDNERSRWSPISKTALPEFPENMQGARSVIVERDNAIDVTFSTGHHTVRKILLAAREGEIGNWFVWREIDKTELSLADNIQHTVRFFNDDERRFTEIADQNYDLIPQWCGTQELLHNNVIAYGDITEGYNRIPVNMSASYSIANIPNDVDGETVHQVEVGYGASGNIWYVGLVPNYDGNDYYIPEGSVFALSVRLNGPQSTIGQDASRFSLFEAPQTYFGAAGLIQFFDDWAAFLNTLGHGYVYSSAPGPAVIAGSQNLLIDKTAIPGGFSFSSVRVRVFQPNTRYKSWKKGVTQVFGIQYYDEVNRDGTVLTSPDTRVYVKRHTEEDRSPLANPEGDYLVQIALTINHVPPPWAKYYQIMYLGNTDMLSFQQRTVITAEFEINTSGRIKLSLEKFYQNSNAGASYWHEIQPGDRVRFIRKQTAPEKGTPVYVEESLDFTVMEYDPIGGVNNTEAIWVEPFDFESVLASGLVFTDIVDGSRAFLIEIYAQRLSSEERVWREIGEVFEVVDAHTPQRRHVGQEFTPSVVPAVHVIDSGDVYIRLRRMGTGYSDLVALNWYVEDFHYTDYTESNIHDLGRLGLFDVEARQRRFITKIRGSEKFIEEGNINGLSRFNSLEQVILSTDYGPIRKLIEVGFTLKAICERMNFSLYVDRQETHGADGNTSLQYIRQTFGTPRPHEETWGTQNGRSVVKVDRQVYFLDYNNNRVIQDSANGQAEITDSRKAQQFLKEFLSGIAFEETAFVAGYSPDHDHVIFSLKFRTTERTIVYSRKTNAWEYRTAFFMEQVMNVGDTMYSGRVGELYEHTGDNEGLVYGVARQGKVVFPVSPIALQNTVPLAVQYYSDKRFRTMIVAAFESGSYNEMEGLIPQDRLLPYENRFAAFIGGDINDPGAEEVTDAAKSLNGRDIRGESFKVDLRFDEGEVRGLIFHYKNSLV